MKTLVKDDTIYTFDGEDVYYFDVSRDFRDIHTKECDMWEEYRKWQDDNLPSDFQVKEDSAELYFGVNESDFIFDEVNQANYDNWVKEMIEKYNLNIKVR